MGWDPPRLCACAVLIPAAKPAFSESPDSEPGADVEAASSDEIRRGVAELGAGAAKAIPWEGVRKELFGRLHDG